jgi:aspartate beta-hydroxylase
MNSSNPLAEQLLDRALAARQRGASHEEQQLLDEALALNPGDPRILNARGMRALADHDYGLAVERFAAAAAADPQQPALWLNLATAHRGNHDDAGEQAALQTALDIDQLQLTAQLRMAELLERRGLLSEAARHWGAVVQLGQGLDAPSPGITAAVRQGQVFLDKHNIAYASELEAELAGAVPDDVRGHRFRVCVDHMLGRRRVYANQCAGVYYPFLPADEFFDPDLFPWFAALEAKTAEIRAEALALLAGATQDLRPYVRLDPGTPDNKWSALDGSLDWGACFLWEYGVRNEAVCARCPATAAAIEAIPQNRVPGRAPSAFFSVLKAGAHIPPHTGVTNTRTIIHLPLVVPPDCSFRVGGETRKWVEGQAFAFDDTIEHEAWNRSDQQRIVLILDVWNPHLTVEEQYWLSKLFAVADRGLVAPRA